MKIELHIEEIRNMSKAAREYDLKAIKSRRITNKNHRLESIRCKDQRIVGEKVQTQNELWKLIRFTRNNEKDCEQIQQKEVSIQ